MALEIVCGAPGGGKSYMAVDKYVDHSLKNKRMVVTNLPISLPAILDRYGEEGVALIRVIDFTQAMFSYDKVLEVQKTGEPEEIDTLPDYWTWRGANGLGAIFIIDEAADILGAGSVSEDVQKFFRYHRHGGYDVIMLTQAIGYLHTSIRKSAETAYHVKNLTKAGLKRCSVVEIQLVQGNEVKSKQTFKSFAYRPAIFELYQSRTILQENIKDAERVGAVKLWRHPLMLVSYSSVPLLLFAVYLAFTSVPLLKKTFSPPASSQVLSSPSSQSTSSTSSSSSPQSSSSSPSSSFSPSGVYTLVGYASPDRLYIRFPSGRVVASTALFDTLPSRCAVRFSYGKVYECGDTLPPPSPAGASPRGPALADSERGFASPRPTTRVPPATTSADAGQVSPTFIDTLTE